MNRESPTPAAAPPPLPGEAHAKANRTGTLADEVRGGSLSRLWHGDALLGWLLLVAVALRLAYFALAGRFLPLSGDEPHYFATAERIGSFLAHLLRLELAGAREVAHQIVDKGWFMPGVSLVLAPVRALTDSLVATRAYMLVVNLVLVVLVGRAAFATLPRRWAATFVTLMAVFPANVAFGATLWGDLLAGQFVLLLWLRLTRVIAAPRPPAGARLGLSVGACLLAIVYTRPGLLLTCPLVVLMLWIAHVHWLGLRRSVLPALGTGALAAIVVVVGMAPWQLATYDKFGGFFLTTTSIDTHAILILSPKEYLIERRRPGVNIYYKVYEETQRAARRNGNTFAAELRGTWKRQLPTVTFARYKARVRKNLRQFFGSASQFLERFRRLAVHGGAGSHGALHAVLFQVNRALWYASLAGAALLLFLPLARDWKDLWLLTLTKATVLLICTQPLMALTHGRYVTTLIPMLVLLWTSVVAPGASAWRGARSRPGWLSCLGVQGACAAAFAAVAVALW